MNKINTVDLILCIKRLKEDADSKLDQSIKLKHESDAINETIKAIESEFEVNIRHFNMERANNER